MSPVPPYASVGGGSSAAPAPKVVSPGYQILPADDGGVILVDGTGSREVRLPLLEDVADGFRVTVHDLSSDASDANPLRVHSPGDVTQVDDNNNGVSIVEGRGSLTVVKGSTAWYTASLPASDGGSDFTTFVPSASLQGQVGFADANYQIQPEDGVVSANGTGVAYLPTGVANGHTVIVYSGGGGTSPSSPITIKLAAEDEPVNGSNAGVKLTHEYQAMLLMRGGGQWFAFDMPVPAHGRVVTNDYSQNVASGTTGVIADGSIPAASAVAGQSFSLLADGIGAIDIFALNPFPTTARVVVEVKTPPVSLSIPGDGVSLPWARWSVLRETGSGDTDGVYDARHDTYAPSVLGTDVWVPGATTRMVKNVAGNSSLEFTVSDEITVIGNGEDVGIVPLTYEDWVTVTFYEGVF